MTSIHQCYTKQTDRQMDRQSVSTQ